MRVILSCATCGLYHYTWADQARCTREYYDRLNEELLRMRTETKPTWGTGGDHG